MNKKGFTLIELLIVIGIIGLLAAFMLPTFTGVRDRAKEASVKSVLHSTQLAVEGYNLVNESFPVATNITMNNLYQNYLKLAGTMNTEPNNPFTGKPYSDSDSAGKIMYNYDLTANTYTITAYKKDGSTVLQQLTNLD